MADTTDSPLYISSALIYKKAFNNTNIFNLAHTYFQSQFGHHQKMVWLEEAIIHKENPKIWGSSKCVMDFMQISFVIAPGGTHILDIHGCATLMGRFFEGNL